MNWQQRLREMVLAGGALAAAACADNSGSSVFADSGSDDAGPDGNVGPGVGFCCNANGDPCCPSLYCDAAVSPQCTEKMTCEADGGTWSYPGCTTDAGPPDADSDAPRDAPADATGDAPTDAAAYPDVSFCCNANADPCCPSLHCGATVTVQCTAKMACEADGGTWDYGPQGCAVDAGPRDAGPDGNGQPD